MTKEAYFYTKQADGNILCQLCPHHCSIAPEKTGRCRQYQHLDAGLYALSYGEIAILAIDPMEKKPLYHFFPGEKILSAGSYGCNLSCSFCQNHDLSFGKGVTSFISPQQILDRMKEHALTHFAFTYNEPIVHYEFVLDTFRFLKKHAVHTVLVTNGFIEEAPLLELLPFTDAMNIDLKGPASFYQAYCHGQLSPVQKSIQHAYQNTHVEISILIIPGCNDQPGDWQTGRDFLTTLSPLIPVHLNRYFPAHHMAIPSTPLPTLLQARQYFLQTMPYVYIGNTGLPDVQDTFCSHCHARLIKRENYDIYYTNILKGICQVCGEKVNIIMRDSA